LYSIRYDRIILVQDIRMKSYSYPTNTTNNINANNNTSSILPLLSQLPYHMNSTVSPSPSPTIPTILSRVDSVVHASVLYEEESDSNNSMSSNNSTSSRVRVNLASDFDFSHSLLLQRYLFEFITSSMIIIKHYIYPTQQCKKLEETHLFTAVNSPTTTK